MAEHLKYYYLSPENFEHLLSGFFRIKMVLDEVDNIAVRNEVGSDQNMGVREFLSGFDRIKEILHEFVRFEIKNEVQNNQNINGISGDDAKKKRPQCQSQPRSKKLKTEEEDPVGTCIDDLPNELLERILKNLETDDVIAAGQTCRRWFSFADRMCQTKAKEISDSWNRSYHPAEIVTAVLLAANDYLPNQLITSKAEKLERFWHLNCILSPAEVHCTSLLAASGHLPRQVITNRAERIARNWSQSSHEPSPAEVNFTASLAAHGHLPRQILTRKAEDVQQSLHLPSRAQVRCAAALATLGFITRVRGLRLGWAVADTSRVQAGDLGSLVRCVTDHIDIANVTGDLSPVLSNLRCRELIIASRSLSTADTQQLVAAMVTRVKEVWLDEGLALDMATLAQYDGKGRCGTVRLAAAVSAEYGDQVKTWAEHLGWETGVESSGYIIVRRP